MTPVCPTCRRPFPPPEPTEERPEPLPDHRLELLVRLAGSGRLTAQLLAQYLYQSEPTRSQVERARAMLTAAVAARALRVVTSDRERVYLPPSNTTVRTLELLNVTQVQTARTAACHLFGTDRPKPSELEIARRRLEQLVSSGQAMKATETDGTVWFRPVAG